MRPTSLFDLVLDQYSDGGWIWFDIVADEKNAIFEGAEWTTEQEPVRAGQGIHRHHDVQQARLLHLDADDPRRSA